MPTPVVVWEHLIKLDGEYNHTIQECPPDCVIGLAWLHIIFFRAELLAVCQGPQRVRLLDIIVKRLNSHYFLSSSS